MADDKTYACGIEPEIAVFPRRATWVIAFGRMGRREGISFGGSTDNTPKNLTGRQFSRPLVFSGAILRIATNRLLQVGPLAQRLFSRVCLGMDDEATAFLTPPAVKRSRRSTTTPGCRNQYKLQPGTGTKTLCVPWGEHVLRHISTACR